MRSQPVPGSDLGVGRRGEGEREEGERESQRVALMAMPMAFGSLRRHINQSQGMGPLDLVSNLFEKIIEQLRKWNIDWILMKLKNYSHAIKVHVLFEKFLSFRNSN